MSDLLYRRGREFAAAMGESLAKRRAFLNLSQTELGEIAGVGQPFLSRIENGNVVANVATLLRLAEALDCSLEVRLIPNSPNNVQDEIMYQQSQES